MDSREWRPLQRHIRQYGCMAAG